MGTQILFIFCHQLVEFFANKNKGGLMRRQVLKKLCKITRLMISDVWFIIIIIIIIIIVIIFCFDLYLCLQVIWPW